MNNSTEILSVSEKLGISASALDQTRATLFIESTLAFFAPRKRSGHLTIDNHSIQLDLEKNEFTYSQRLNEEKGYVFFDQESTERNQVVCFESVRDVSRVIENSFGAVAKFSG